MFVRDHLNKIPRDNILQTRVHCDSNRLHETILMVSLHQDFRRPRLECHYGWCLDTQLLGASPERQALHEEHSGSSHVRRVSHLHPAEPCLQYHSW
jgi:hypothetical protein